MVSKNKESSASRVGRTALLWSRDGVLSAAKVLETDTGESLATLSERTAEISTMIPKQFGTEVTKGFERNFAESWDRAATMSGGMKNYLLESSFGSPA